MRDSTFPTIRLAFVVQNLNFGGMERVVHALARELPPRGFEIHIIALEYLGQFATGLEGIATLHQVPPMSRLSLFYPGALAEVLRKINPHIVHTHTGVWLKGTRAARLAGIPVTIHTEHGRPDPVPLSDRIIDWWASQHTDVILAVSEPLATILKQQIVSDASKIRVLTNGVEITPPLTGESLSALREELGIPEGGLVIGSVGRLEPVKQFDLALRAFARLLRHPDRTTPTYLVIAGDGSERQHLEGIAEALGVTEYVRFLGWRTDTRALNAAFDVFTLTSRSEGTSISLLEAMSAGICPVVTDVGGNRAVLGPDLESLLAPANDEAALTSIWHKVLRDSSHRREMGSLARARASAEYSLHRMVDNHVVLYRSQTAAQSGPPTSIP